MNLREIVGGIRLRVIEEGNRGGAATGGSKEISACRDASIELRAACEDMQNLGTGVGRMPPGPATTRAKFGAYLVRIVQRMLFWYTPQIVRFNMAASSFAERACTAADKQVAAIQEINTKLTELSGEVHRAVPPLRFPAAEPPLDFFVAGFDRFVSDFRSRSESLSADRQVVFRELHQMIDLARPVEGPWLDVECGSGAWMKSVAGGHQIAGVEPNEAEADRCRVAGIPVSAMNPITFLSEESGPLFAVITALRVSERHPMAWSFELLRVCAGRLAPGGLLLVTGADPESVLAGASEFWEDPRSVRPVPSSTVIAMTGYLGLSLIEARSLCPWADDEQLPLAALEPVQALNARLYAPREYAILVRREIPR